MRTQVSFDEFLSLIKSDSKEVCNLEVKLIDGKPSRIDVSTIMMVNKVINCYFKGEKIEFYDSLSSGDFNLKFSLQFDDCEFICNLSFLDCSIRYLTFNNVNATQRVYLGVKEIQSLSINSSQGSSSRIKELTLHSIPKIEAIKIYDLKNSDSVDITNCKAEKIKINRCSFLKFSVSNSKILSDFQFTMNEPIRSFFKDCDFQKADFRFSKFVESASFKRTNFNGSAIFSVLPNRSGHMLFDNCNFVEYTPFDSSKINSLKLVICRFQETVSFQNVTLGSVSIAKTVFEKITFFDGITIESPNDSDIGTIRVIKQQLLKSDNKIDYDRFRFYELNAYRKEIKESLDSASRVDRIRLKRDAFILTLGSFFSNNGTDWLRAAKRTFQVGLFFYSLFFLTYNFSSNFSLTWTGTDNFMVGFFRFLLLSDFHNPLIQQKAYPENTLLWLLLIAGKISVAIGIYEIVVSFRKFRKS